MLEQLKFQNEDCKKLVLFIAGEGKIKSEPNEEIREQFHTP